MKVKKSKREITQTDILIIFVVSLIIITLCYSILVNSPKNQEEKIKCIGNKTILYISQNNIYSRKQMDVFGENLQYLTIIDCQLNPGKCKEIEAIPTWDINGTKIIGIQSIAKLEGLTRC